jgi:hypothetical protein
MEIKDYRYFNNKYGAAKPKLVVKGWNTKIIII